MEALDILYAYVSQFVDISRSDYEKMLIGWVVEPVDVNGETVGAVMMKENEIHIAVDPKSWNRWAARSLSRKYLVDGIAKHGHMTTSASKSNAVAISFIERLGFYRTGEDGNFFKYRIDHAKIK